MKIRHRCLFKHSLRRMKIAHRVCTLLCVSVLLSGCKALAVQSPEEVVAQTSQRMIDALKEYKASLKDEPKIVHDLIETIVLPHFDVDYVVRLILGKHWLQATADQRRRFKQAFQLLVMNTYAKALLEYSGEKVKVLPLAGDFSQLRTVMVHSVLDSADAKPIEVNYRMRKTGDEWKVIDLTVENVSLILSYKHSFAEQIREKGLDVLIVSIESKNAGFRF